MQWLQKLTPKTCLEEQGSCERERDRVQTRHGGCWSWTQKADIYFEGANIEVRKQTKQNSFVEHWIKEPVIDGS